VALAVLGSLTTVELVLEISTDVFPAKEAYSQEDYESAWSDGNIVGEYAVSSLPLLLQS
jgi:hypothetical protein